VLNIQTAGTTAVTVDASQNVGIGTASPVSRLHVTGSGSPYISVTSTNTNNFVQALDGSGLAIGTTSSATNKDILFFSSSVERARFNTTGALVFSGGTTTANGIGITFPATQSASSNANTLDDYEEGTIVGLTDGSGAGLSITFNNAKYTKIGRLVYISISTIEYPVTANTAAASIAGLPFTNSAADVGSSTLISNNTFSNRALVVSNSTTIFFYPTASAGQALNNQLSGTTIYGFSAVYQV
jgi:hypothetical protein